MNTVTSVREQLEAQRRRAQGIGIAHAGVYLAAVVLVALRLYVPAAVAAGVNLLVFLFFVRGQIKGYSQAVARANVLCGLCAPLEGPLIKNIKNFTFLQSIHNKLLFYIFIINTIYFFIQFSNFTF